MESDCKGETKVVLLPAPQGASLIDIRVVATLLACSTRHVRRLAEAGRMPSPLHLGGLLRWRRADMDEWIAAGCPHDAAPASSTGTSRR